MSLTSSIYDHFVIWPSSVTLTSNLSKQLFWTVLLLEDNNYAKFFWNPCINVPVMARTSSIYYHFDLYLTPMTLTFNLREKNVSNGTSTLQDNNCAKFFKSMNKCTIYGPDKRIIWPFDLYLTPVTLTFNLGEKMFKMALFLFESNKTAKLFSNQWVKCTIMLRTSSIHVYDHFDIYLTPVTLTLNLSKNVPNNTSPHQGQQLCQIVFKSMHYCTSYGPDKSVRTHGYTDERTYTELKF